MEGREGTVRVASFIGLLAAEVTRREISEEVPSVILASIAAFTAAVGESGSELRGDPRGPVELPDKESSLRRASAYSLVGGGRSPISSSSWSVSSRLSILKEEERGRSFLEIWPRLVFDPS